MPKSKKRRKQKKQKYRLGTGSSSGANKGAAEANNVENGTKKKTPKKTSKKSKSQGGNSQKTTMKEFLYLNQAEGLRRLIRFFPLFAGAWIAGGVVLNQVWSFILLTAVMIVAYFAAHPEKRKEFIFSELIDWILLALIVGMLLFLHMITDAAQFTLIAAGVALLIYLSERLVVDSPRALLLLCAERVVEMSLFSFLSIYSQIIEREQVSVLQYFWEFCVIGFAPACCLSASYVLLHIDVLNKYGWKRTKPVYKDGKELEEGKKRPAGIAQLYSLLLISGPALPVVLVPLNIFPATFLLLGISVVSIPKLCQSLFDGDTPDGLLFIKTVHVAAMVSLIVTTAALLANVFS